MSQIRDIAEIKPFYDRWKGTVFTYCRLFLGDEKHAEHAIQGAFLSYVRKGFRLDLNQFPLPLLRCVVEVAGQQCRVQTPRGEGNLLKGAISSLPSEERSVFILRGVLGLQAPWVAAMTGLPRASVKELWLRALLNVHQRLPRDFFKERTTWSLSSIA